MINNFDDDLEEIFLINKDKSLYKERACLRKKKSKESEISEPYDYLGNFIGYLFCLLFIFILSNC